ncbi:MAG: hypothetical protein JXR27_13035 [Paludibacteraceae bacterium]|nr:hypothetical protein [Paludibacteraceae bacterium]
MKTVIKILLFASIGLLTYFCIMSIMTPIQFGETKDSREKVIIQRLIDIRSAQMEFKDQKGGFTTNFDELIGFMKTAKKKSVLKEGSLTDKQLEAGLTEEKAAAIVRKGNMKEIAANGLENFRRDTAYLDMIETVYGKRFTKETIDQIAYVPFTDSAKFELKVNNSYFNATGIQMALFEASVEYKVYLHDLDRQEVLNVIDIQRKLDKFPGLKVGSVDAPNNNAGNWE